MLQTETFRKAVTDREASGLKFYSSTFIATNEGNGTYREVGLFGDDATGSANSGTLFARASINETKVDGESVTIDYDIEAS